MRMHLTRPAPGFRLSPVNTPWTTIETSIRETLTCDHAHPLLIESFMRHARLVFDGTTGMISRHDITPVDDLPDYEQLGVDEARSGREQLSRVVMIKLNGGLGTGMGLERAKSLLPVKQGLSFLDIIAKQVLHLREKHKVALPLLLMTSFSTDRDTLDALAAYPELLQGQAGLPLTFLQNRVPKLLADSLLPATSPDDPDKAWCPPGHGDIYTALITSGLLDQLIAQKFRYAFISNADNLGAVIDPVIPGMMNNRCIPFLLEVADRTEADRKGGHLARSAANGQLVLRESAQCPDDEKDEFQDIRKYRYFNTNNLWIDLTALDELVKTTGAVPSLALMVNRKTLDPRNEASPPVVQLETAMGSAVSSFRGAAALRVPRTRFAPVKTTDDLLGLWSDAFELTPEMHIQLAPERAKQGPPVIKLDPKYFRKIDDFSARFPDGAPSLLHCRSLTVEGDHRFSAGVEISGDVALKNPSPEPAIVPRGRLGTPRPTTA